MKIFKITPSFIFEENERKSIEKEISFLKKDIVNISESEYINKLFKKYSLTPIKLLDDTVNDKGSYQKKISDTFNRICDLTYFKYEVNIIFEGSEKLFQITPPTHVMNTYEIETCNNVITYNFEILNRSEYDKVKENTYNTVFSNLNNINNYAVIWNNKLEDIIKDIFKKIKNDEIERIEFNKKNNIKY